MINLNNLSEKRNINMYQNTEKLECLKNKHKFFTKKQNKEATYAIKAGCFTYILSSAVSPFRLKFSQDKAEILL